MALLSGWIDSEPVILMREGEKFFVRRAHFVLARIVPFQGN